ncbi:oxidoreductase [Glycomyces sp. NPDC021274]|uniref:globin domain-containing protein n=1 Tax=Glycomyces sp. NPDC021274 TaxID=3155120 RepID=UPI0033C0F515
MESTVFAAAGGADAMLRLARAWHERCLAGVHTRHPFTHPGQHPQHLERLAAYWGEQLGGPPAYTGSLGDHSRVMRMHSGNGEHRDLDDEAQECFALALDDAGIPDDPRLRETLKAWFRWATDLMARYPDAAAAVPDRLEMPLWGWNGPTRP